MLNIKVKKLDERATVPKKGSLAAAGYDLYALLPESDAITIQPHTTQKIGTGVAMAIPNGHFGAIFARSGLATKEGLRPANCVGVVDADYRGEVIVAVHNDSTKNATITDGERIAQIVIMPCPKTEFVMSNTLDDTQRGDGGFGSTGN